LNALISSFNDLLHLVEMERRPTGHRVRRQPKNAAVVGNPDVVAKAESLTELIRQKKTRMEQASAVLEAVRSSANRPKTRSTTNETGPMKRNLETAETEKKQVIKKPKQNPSAKGSQKGKSKRGRKKIRRNK
jgi:hypothetical protein